MKIAHAAVWTVESFLHDAEAAELSLNDLAKRLGVTRFHLARAFSSSFDMTLMQYVRRCRLALAATQLKLGNVRVLDVALAAGYGSQAAFTRAFQAEFQQTPASYRQNLSSTSTVPLEAFTMQPNTSISLAPPSVKKTDAWQLIGLSRHYAAGEGTQIPDQWAAFNRDYLLPAKSAAYGVCYNTDEDGAMDYLCGVNQDELVKAPANATQLSLPGQSYVVFNHSGHVAEIGNVWAYIWNEGLSEGGFSVVGGPQLERYGPEFDPATGAGGYEIWIPISRG